MKKKSKLALTRKQKVMISSISENQNRTFELDDTIRSLIDRGDIVVVERFQPNHVRVKLNG